MKKLLYINGCMRNGSRTKKLSDKYINYKFKDDDIVFDEVKISELDIMPMNDKDISKRTKDIENSNFEGSEYKLARQFADANIIVISAPYWDASFPSKLKVYFEHICVNNITFSYGSDGSIVKKCLADKLIYITTSGGYIRKNSSVQMYIEELCALFDIKDVKFYCAEGLDIFPDKVEQILQDTFLHMISN